MSDGEQEVELGPLSRSKGHGTCGSGRGLSWMLFPWHHPRLRIIPPVSIVSGNNWKYCFRQDHNCHFPFYVLILENAGSAPSPSPTSLQGSKTGLQYQLAWFSFLSVPGIGRPCLLTKQVHKYFYWPGPKSCFANLMSLDSLVALNLLGYFRPHLHLLCFGPGRWTISVWKNTDTAK